MSSSTLDVMNSGNSSLPKSVIELPRFPLPPETLLRIYQSVLGKKEYAIYNYGYHYPAAEVPELQEFLSRFDLVWDVLFFSTGRVQVGFPIHKDGKDDCPFNASINFPLLNCDSRAETVFYKEEPGASYRCMVGARIANEGQDLIESERFTFDSSQPKYFLFNAGSWHSVEQKGNYAEERVMFSWRFKPDISWEEAVRRVRSFM